MKAIYFICTIISGLLSFGATLQGIRVFLGMDPRLKSGTSQNLASALVIVSFLLLTRFFFRKYMKQQHHSNADSDLLDV